MRKARVDRWGRQGRKASQVQQGFREKQAPKDLADLQERPAHPARREKKVRAVFLGSQVPPVLEALQVLRVVRAPRGCLVLSAPGAVPGHKDPKAHKPVICPQMIG